MAKETKLIQNSQFSKSTTVNVAKSQTVQFKPQSKSQQGSPEQRKAAGKKQSLLPLGQSVLADRSTSRPVADERNLT